MSVGYLKKCTTGGKAKAQHATRAEAEAQRESMIARGVWTRGGSNTYGCNQCGCYHAGSLGGINRGGSRKRRPKNIPRFLPTQ